MWAESNLIVLVHDRGGDLVGGNLLEEGEFLSFSGHDELCVDGWLCVGLMGGCV